MSDPDPAPSSRTSEPASPVPPTATLRPTAGPPSVATASSLPVFLSTEHWSLLGTRSMTWAEVMSRITIHLTVVSAFLVVLALTVQVTGFSTSFRVLSIGLASAALVMGILTAVRVNLASNEDADLVRAMNRIRHAYVDLVPEIGPYLSASMYDDVDGLMHTYALGRPRNVVLHVVASTSFFLMVVNAIVAGTLGALVASTAGAGGGIMAVVGCASAIVYIAGHLEVSRRAIGPRDRDVRFPHPGPVTPAIRPAPSLPMSAPDEPV